MVSHSTIGASQIALSIQNPSQSGPRTQGDGHFRIRGVAVAISTTAAGEERSTIRAIAECAVGGAHLDLFIRQPRYFLSCMSTPAPVRLTSTPLCVAAIRTLTPA